MDNAEERIFAHAWEAGRPGTIASATGARDASQMDVATSDLIGALDDFNRVLNGPRPSLGGGREVGRAGSLPVRVAYSVAEASRMLREAGATDCAWRVDTAWLAVLSGDIDDVRQHVEWEERAKR